MKVPELDPDRSARLVLSVVGEPGDPRLLGLVAEIGACEVLHALRSQSSHGELRDALAERLAVARPAEVVAAAARQGIRFVTPDDAEWPRGLDDLDHAPLLHQRGRTPLGLWVRGPLRLDEVAGGVAVVGSRSATAYGSRVAGEVAAVVAGSGAAVISGAAFGIDQAAHRGALAVRGPTVAVLACGVDRFYPLAHEPLLTMIAEEGLVVSEAAPGGAPTRVRFLARNRLIAALGRGVVVVEAAVRSGALNTANWGDGLGRTVMGIPGPVTSAASQGVHQMIRTRNALLVTDGADVLEAVSAVGVHAVTQRRGPEHPRDTLTIEEQQVLDALPLGRGVGIQQVARTAGTSMAVAQRALASCVAGGLVQREGDLWQLVPGP